MYSASSSRTPRQNQSNAGSTTLSPSPSMSSTATATMCEICGKKQRYSDGYIVHPYCGKKCAIRAETQKGITPRNSVFSLQSQVDTPNNGPLNGTCQTPGCSVRVFVGPNGIPSKYCSKSHRWLGQHGCISCRKAPPANCDTVFCGGCNNRIIRRSPMILKVPDDHGRFTNIESQFQRRWLHRNKDRPQVRAIYKIVLPADRVAKYQRYLDRIAAKRDHVAEGRTRGNENRRWHGTTRTCNIGDNGITLLCGDNDCGVCGIIQSSFKLAFSGRRHRFERFGKGIYFSSTSSKSDDYSENERASEWKALLLNKVVIGGGVKMTENNTSLTKPPFDCDSVLGETGEDLNYDEVVVYNNDAALPSYLVMYDAVDDDE